LAFRFRATISLHAEQTPERDFITETIRRVLLAAENAHGLSTHQLANRAGVSTRAMRTRMAKLMDSGLVTVVGKNARDPQRKYHWKGA
jgi:predicted ArsR family transcriptional regulator